MEFLKLFSFCLLLSVANAIFSINTRPLGFINIGQHLRNTFLPLSTSPHRIVPQVTNGQKADVGQFPWHASLAILYRDQDITANATYCSGAILNEKWIIATADCVAKARSIRVDVGSISIDKPGVSVYPDAFAVHPRYNKDKFTNNVALLRLPNNDLLKFPTDSSPSYAPVRLPQRRQKNETFVGYETYFSGFGDKAPKARDMSETLFYAEQRVIPNTACVGFFANDLQLITSKVICSLSVDMKQSACLGDAGAPLVTNEYGTSTLIGLLSFMHESGNCGQQPVPAVFTRITTHFDWIAQTTNYQFRP